VIWDFQKKTKRKQKKQNYTNPSHSVPRSGPALRSSPVARVEPCPVRLQRRNKKAQKQKRKKKTKKKQKKQRIKKDHLDANARIFASPAPMISSTQSSPP
jgi:hypothetical protein